MASDDGTRVGAAVVSSTELWLHRPFAQRVAVTPELLGGAPVGRGVVAQLAAPGSSVVTAILPAAGVIDVLIDDRGHECGVVAWTEFVVD